MVEPATEGVALGASCDLPFKLRNCVQMIVKVSFMTNQQLLLITRVSGAC